MNRLKSGQHVKKTIAVLLCVVLCIGMLSGCINDTAVVSKIVLASTDIQTSYEIGEKISYDGLKVQAKLDNEFYRDLKTDEYEVSTDFDNNSAGDYTVTISYKSNTSLKTNYQVKVNPTAAVSLAITTPATKQIYEIGEKIDYSGLVLEKTVSTLATVNVAIADCFVSSDFNSAAAGTYAVNLMLKENSAVKTSYSVTVLAAHANSLELNIDNVTREFSVGQEISYTGLVVNQLMSDGTSVLLDDSKYAITTDYDKNLGGTYTVTITLNADNNIVATYSVSVTSSIITFETNLKDNAQVLGSTFAFDFTAKDSKGEKLDDVTADIDGNAAIRVNWDDVEKTSYTIDLNNDVQNYKIIFTATDSSKNVVSREINITHPPVKSGDLIGQIVFSVDAFTIGHGYIVAPTVMDIYEGENSGYSLARLIRSNGYCFKYSGEISSGFYIQSIISGTPHSTSGCGCKELSTTIPIVNPKNLLISVNPPQNIIDEVGELDIKSYEQGSLGEHDLNSMAGWMYAVNNVFPGVGFSDSYPMHGDVIRAQFTLEFGSDIGGGWGGSYFEEVSRDSLTTLISSVFSLTNEQRLKLAAEFNAALDAIAEFGITQEKLDAAYSSLEVAYKKVVEAQ